MTTLHVCAKHLALVILLLCVYALLFPSHLDEIPKYLCCSTICGDKIEYINLYIPTQTPAEDWSGHLQSPGWQPIFLVTVVIWGFASIENGMVVHAPNVFNETKCHWGTIHNTKSLEIAPCTSLLISCTGVGRNLSRLNECLMSSPALLSGLFVWLHFWSASSCSCHCLWGVCHVQGSWQSREFIAKTEQRYTGNNTLRYYVTQQRYTGNNALALRYIVT